MKESKSTAGWLLEGLGAPGPEPSLRKELMLFGQFVGDWDILESRFLEEDGRWSYQTGELHWNWILGGRALQDVWMYHYEGSGELVAAGTTLRFYDTKKDIWRSIWITPHYNDVGMFLGRKVGKEIVLELQEESKQEGEGEVKWIFSEITSNSFKWRSEESANAGQTWILKHEMKIVRRKPEKGVSLNH